MPSQQPRFSKSSLIRTNRKFSQLVACLLVSNLARSQVADSTEWCEQNLAPDKNYAGKGYDYYEIYQDYVAPMPYPSWILDEKRKWKTPVDIPKYGKRYKWDGTYKDSENKSCFM